MNDGMMAHGHFVERNVGKYTHAHTKPSVFQRAILGEEDAWDDLRHINGVR